MGTMADETDVGAASGDDPIADHVVEATGGGVRDLGEEHVGAEGLHTRVRRNLELAVAGADVLLGRATLLRTRQCSTRTLQLEVPQRQTQRQTARCCAHRSRAAPWVPRPISNSAPMPRLRSNRQRAKAGWISRIICQSSADAALSLKLDPTWRAFCAAIQIP